MKIKNFYGNKSEELKSAKDFEEHCIMLSQHTNKHVKELSVKEYFSLMKYVTDQNKKSKKGKKWYFTLSVLLCKFVQNR